MQGGKCGKVNAKKILNWGLAPKPLIREGGLPPLSPPPVQKHYEGHKGTKAKLIRVWSTTIKTKDVWEKNHAKRGVPIKTEVESTQKTGF